MRDKNGYLIIDDYEATGNFIKGRKEKEWLIKDGVSYLFKTGASFYECWAEVFASEIGKQCGFDVAEYDLAVRNGRIGVISKNFLSTDELIISGDNVLADSNKIIMENNINVDVTTYHSIESIIFAIAIYTGSRNTEEILKSLINLWCFDGLLMESDRNATNWSLIRKNNQFRLSPIYDCSTIARMNNDVSSLLDGLRDYGMVGKLTDSIKYSLTLHNEDSADNFLWQFDTFCETYPEYATDIIKSFSKVNVREAINNIENRINENKNEDERVSFPFDASLWLEKVINFRLADIMSIYKNNKEKNNSKHL